MNRLEQVSQWLGNRQRSYADGLSLFCLLAKQPMKEKFEKYLHGAPEAPCIFDPHFTQLVNCLARIEREAKESPALYPAAHEEVIISKTLSDPERKEEIDTRNETIVSLQEEIDELTIRIDELENCTDNHSDELDDLQTKYDKKVKVLAELRSEVDALNTPGIKIVTEESLTPTLQKAYNRIKEITPLYASLHNDIANPDIPAEERQVLAEDLCKLDDERRKLWKQIDAWAEGKGENKLSEPRPTYSVNPIVRGIEIARQIKRLKQNIINSRIAAERAEKDGRKVVQQNALDRIVAYETELKELETEIAAPSETITG